MKLFDVYPLYDVTPISAKGIVVTDDKGQEYLDFYKWNWQQNSVSFHNVWTITFSYVILGPKQMRTL